MLNAVGLEALVDPKHPDYPLFQHLAYDQDKLDRLWEDQTMLRTPIVRNGRQATVGYCPEVWAAWGVNSPLYGTQVPVC